MCTQQSLPCKCMLPHFYLLIHDTHTHQTNIHLLMPHNTHMHTIHSHLHRHTLLRQYVIPYMGLNTTHVHVDILLNHTSCQLHCTPPHSQRTPIGPPTATPHTYRPKRDQRCDVRIYHLGFWHWVLVGWGGGGAMYHTIKATKLLPMSHPLGNYTHSPGQHFGMIYRTCQVLRVELHKFTKYPDLTSESHVPHYKSWQASPNVIPSW